MNDIMLDVSDKLEEIKQVIDDYKKSLKTNEYNDSLIEKRTFLKIVEDNIIYIPRIQRNYVQGLEYNRDIRERFIKDIFSSLDNKGINLDIIYGIKKNNLFIPIDGQQRLTTLFLLYWYIILFELTGKKREQEFNKIKITYETRESSKEFFDLLCDYDKVKEINKGNMSISNKIINLNKYFYSKWNNDITIKSSLKMLDEIENNYKNLSKKGIYPLLEEKIEFWCNFIPTNANIESELYIKMNSTGKELSDYEKLKANIEQYIYISNLSNEEKKEIYSNLDNEWIDTFYKFSDNKNKIEDYYYEFIRQIFKYNTLKNATEGNINNKEEIDEFKKNIRLFKPKVTNNKDSINYNDEIFLKKFKNIMNNIKYLYQYNEDFVNIKSIFNNIVINNKDEDYRKELIFFSAMIYLSSRETINEYDYINWLRISRNYINHYYHIQIVDRKNSESEYFQIFRFLNNLHNEYLNNNTKNIVEFIINYNGKDVLKSNELKWYNLEKIKADYICKNEEWKQLILDIDKLDYFAGVNSFLFEIFKNNNEIDLLKNYYNLTKEIFSDSNIKNYSLQKALLVKYDNHAYFTYNKENKVAKFYTYVHSDNTNTWIQVLNEYNEEGNAIRSKYKDLLDYMINNSISIIDIINENTFKKDDYRYYFINYDLFSYCSFGILSIDDINNNSYTNNISLITKSANSKCYDYLTKILENYLRQYIDNIDYKGKIGITDTYNSENELKINKKYTFIRNNSGKYEISLLKDNKQYKIRYDILENNNSNFKLNSLYNNEDYWTIKEVN